MKLDADETALALAKDFVDLEEKAFPGGRKQLQAYMQVQIANAINEHKQYLQTKLQQRTAELDHMCRKENQK